MSSSQAHLYARGDHQVSQKQGSREKETFKAATLVFVPQGFVTMAVHACLDCTLCVLSMPTQHGRHCILGN